MSAAVFTAKDARQRKHLLWSIGLALDDHLETVEYVARNAFESDATSVYLWTFCDGGQDDGYREGRDHGTREGIRGAVWGFKRPDVIDVAMHARERRRVKHARLQGRRKGK
jgi:hypothetical protein